MKNSIYQAVILAGGLGTRLKPITETLPKCLAMVGERPFLDYLLSHLAKEGFNEVVLLVGYKGEQVVSFVGDGSRWGLKTTCVQEPSLLGTGGALRNAASHLADTFAVFNGDTLLPISYRKPIEWFLQRGADGVLVVCSRGQEGVAVQPNIHLNEEGRVVGYRKGSNSSPYDYIDGGVGLFRKSVIRDIPEGVSSLEETVYRAAIERGTLWGWASPRRFYDMGTPDQLKELEQVLKS